VLVDLGFMMLVLPIASQDVCVLEVTAMPPSSQETFLPGHLMEIAMEAEFAQLTVVTILQVPAVLLPIPFDMGAQQQSIGGTTKISMSSGPKCNAQSHCTN